MDILKNTNAVYQRSLEQYAFYGLDKNGYSVEIHIREEIIQKDKKLQFISCFWNEKKSPPTS